MAKVKSVTWSVEATVFTDGNSHQVTLRFHYDPIDPFAVEMAIIRHTYKEPVVTWCFDRDLLRMGLVRRAGVGDVKIAPNDDNTLVIYLSTVGAGNERCTLVTSIVQVQAFLAATDRVITPNSESQFIDWHYELKSLFAA